MREIEIKARKVDGTFTHQGTEYYHLTPEVTREAVSLATLLTATAPTFEVYGRGMNRLGQLPDSAALVRMEAARATALPGIPPEVARKIMPLADGLPPVDRWPDNAEPTILWRRLKFDIEQFMGIKEERILLKRSKNGLYGYSADGAHGELFMSAGKTVDDLLWGALEARLNNTPCVLALRDNALVYTVCSQEAATWLAIAEHFQEIKTCAYCGELLERHTGRERWADRAYCPAPKRCRQRAHEEKKRAEKEKAGTLRKRGRPRKA